MFDVITIGSATRDVFLKSDIFETRQHSDSPTGVEQCFPLGAKIEVKDVVFTTGGGGTNTAVTFARQGFKTGCVGVIADDFNGQEIIKELKSEKVKPFFGIHDKGQTAYSVILVHSNSERTIFSYKGEGHYFDSHKINWSKLKARWFYLDSLGGNWDLWEKSFTQAAAKKIRVACNPGGRELAHGLERLKPYLAQIDIFSLNREEGEQLLSGSGDRHLSTDEILLGLTSLVRGIVVLTLGADGVLVTDRKHIYKAGIPNSPQVERTGAGDAFSSGFVAHYIASGGDIVKAIQFGTANASSVVAQFGPKAGILRKGEWGQWPLVEVRTD